MIFGDPEEIQQKKEEIIQKSVIKKIRSREDRGGGASSSPKPITHPRFLGRSDHTVRILTQPSTPYHLASGDKAPPPSTSVATNKYTCPLCDFATARVNVMLMHSKSHSAPDRTNLANYARTGPPADSKASKSEVKGARLFGDIKTSFVSKRKLFQSQKVNSEPSPKKSKVVKKPKVTKKEREEREEKKNAIFGDWSEDENEEEEERVKLKESIESLFSNEEDSEEEFYQLKTNKQLDVESERETASRSLRERKTPDKCREVPGNKKRKKSKKKQSAADAVSSLIKSSLDSNSPGSSSEDDNFHFFSDNGDLSEDGSPPASPPPATPSKRPVILKKSSSRSFQLPSRPDGKLELIKHETSETKYAGISAKAKAKQLARTQLNKDELFDKLFETEMSPQKEKKLKIEDEVVQEAKIESNEEEPVKEEPAEPEVESSSTETAQKSIETYDFDCDSEGKDPEVSRSDEKSGDQLVSQSQADTSKPPSKPPVVPAVATVSKIVIKSPQKTETELRMQVKPSLSSGSVSKSPLIVRKTTVAGSTKMTSPTRIVTVQTNKVSPAKIITSPVKATIGANSLQKPVLATISKLTVETTKKSSPVIAKKPIIIDTEKPVVAGVTKIVGQPSKNIVLSRPVVSTVNNSVSPLKLGTKIVTLSHKQDVSINSLPSITLPSQRKELGTEKPLTISLESKRSTTIKPIVKTVDIPKRVSKLKEELGSGSKPVVHLDKNEKSKAPSLEIKLDTKPAPVKLSEPAKSSSVVLTEASKSSLSVVTEPLPLNGTKTEVTSVSSLPAAGLQLVSEQGLPVVGDGEGEMIYLLVDDGTDPNLENQTLYIDPSQLAAATGSVPVLLQTTGGGDQLLLQPEALSNLVILEDKVRRSSWSMF